ncbi:MAG: hypothetical protein GWN01_15365 [Nitrosopumilaceae archaeon]|nr:hypothetical protein [Nitrosopumilaceae archaeon]NIU87505.1 hypothetical protein [Nitrosopumilaceae archaeon]NIX62822.1 hypothetical protein [Nitrosopumilaceae archaeon]
MADISKKLKLIAELDDQKVKRQIDQLKKDLEGLSLKGQDLSAFDKSANVLKDAAKELKEALKQFQRISPKRITTVTGTQQKQGTQQAVTRPTRASQVREIFDPEARGGRGRNVRLRGEQEYSKLTQTVYKNEQQRLEAERRYRIKTQELVNQKAEQSARKERQREQRAFEASRRQRERSVRGGLTAAGRQIGMQMPVARQAVESLGERLQGGFTGTGRRFGRRFYRGMRGMGIGQGAARGVMRFAGMAGSALGLGAAAVGVTGLAAAGINENVRTRQQFQTLQAQRQQEEAFALLSQEGLTAGQMRGARRRGESGASGVAGGLSNIISMRGLGALATSIVSPRAGAEQFQQLYRSGRMEAGTREIETQQEVMRLAIEAGSRARGMRDVRFSNLRGGGVTGADLTSLQQAGTTQGFGIAETNQQFAEARQFLGNRGTRRNLGVMQDVFNRTGTGVAAQAQAAEIFTGAQGGRSFDRGTQQVIDVLKKGVASGLDASKASQFLKTTADYVQQNQGLGDIDVGGISTRLSDLAQGFAGGGDVTETNLRQAQQLSAIQRAESTSMSGLSGIGNIVGIQQAFQQSGANLDTGTFLALSNLSQDAGEGDIRTILRDADLGENVDRDSLVQSILESRQNTQTRGSDIVFGNNRNLSRAFRARERGITTEQQIGAEEAETFSRFNRRLRDRGLDTEGALPETTRGAEFQSRVAEAQQQQIAFVEGMEVMSIRTSDAAENLGRLNKEIEKSIRAFQNFQNNSVSRQGGGG